jgi:hypothetical protein
MPTARTHLVLTAPLNLIRNTRFGTPTYFGPLGFANEALRRVALGKWQEMHRALLAHNGDEAERLGRELHDDARDAALAATN